MTVITLYPHTGVAQLYDVYRRNIRYRRNVKSIKTSLSQDLLSIRTLVYITMIHAFKVTAVFLLL